MKIQELTDALKEAGFNQEELDSGCNFTKKAGHISLICYIEPEMDVEFISIYHWNKNDVKGTYNISMKSLSRSNEPIKEFFRNTKNNLPQQVGDFVDTHDELDKVIENLFK